MSTRSRLLRLLAGIAVAVTAALLAGAPPASAHPMPHSVVLLEVQDTSVTAELDLPASDFSRASAIDLTASELPVSAVQSYLAAHLKIPDWTVRIVDVSLSEDEQTSTGTYQELIVHAVFTPPAGADVRHFTLHYDAIVHQVVTHVALVSVRDVWSGKVEQVGTVRTDIRTMTVPPLTVSLDTSSWWQGFVAMVSLGGEHILEGTDHLLFLLILLLPAPLRAVGGRWRELVGARAAMRRIGLTTLAFTCGHSVALAVSSLARIEVPGWPVEAFIAASILVGAVHAVRPVFPGREALVAGLFGLGHGLAFSFTLASLQLTTGRLVLSLFGFNIGIELVQMLIVALALPPLLVLARLRIQPVVRVGGALLTAVAAGGWLLDRLGVPNGVATVADSLAPTTVPVLIALAVIDVVLVARLLWIRSARSCRPALGAAAGAVPRAGRPVHCESPPPTSSPVTGRGSSGVSHTR